MLKIGLIVPDDCMVPRWFKILTNRITNEGVGSIIEIRSLKGSKISRGSINLFYMIDKRFFYRNILSRNKIDYLENCRINTDLYNGTLRNSHIDRDVDLYISLAENPEANYFKSKFGIWEYYLDNNNMNRKYSGLQSVSSETSMSVKIISTIKDDRILIAETRIKNARSYIVTKNNAAEKLIELTVQSLRRPIDRLMKEIMNNTFHDESVRNINFSYFKTFISALKKTLVKRKKKQTEWILFWGNISNEFPMNNNGLNYISQTSDIFWADPFLAEHDGKYYIFVEEFVFSKRKGSIAVLKKSADGEYIRMGTALERNYHLSYPFVFAYEDGVYMIPETSSAETIELYECIQFPLKWKFKKIIFNNVKACDTTLLFYNNTWWMFTSIDKNGWGFDEQLYLYYTDDPINGKWTNHPFNPIVLDTRYGRMAGRIINKDGKLIRPSQDCSQVYGDAVNYMKITKLSKDDYEEMSIFKTVPGSNYLGLHTYNETNKEFIIDVRRYKK